MHVVERRELSLAGRQGKSTANLSNELHLTAVAFDTELGWMAVAFGKKRLHGIVFGHPTCERAKRSLSNNLRASDDAILWTDESRLDSQSPQLRGLIKKLRRVATGEPEIFQDVMIDDGHLTPFGRKVVAACRRITWGRTSSYGMLAAASGSPGAARAVGQVMAKNRFPFVVPCHRVLSTGGKLGGFSAPDGLKMKRRLLEMEREAFTPRT